VCLLGQSPPRIAAGLVYARGPRESAVSRIAGAQPITVLLVEDNAGDARLIAEVLRQAAPGEFALEQVERLEPAFDRLRRAGVDAVLVDLGLPDSQGLETFQRIHLAAPGTPIVVISGLDDEQRALEAVSLGAQDYIVKGRIEGRLLAQVIRYSIERKRAEKALHASERRALTLFDAVDLIVLGLDSAGQVEYVNPFFLQLTGYTGEEVLGQPWIERFLPKAEQAGMRKAFLDLRDRNLHARYQNPIVTKAGEERLVAWYNTVVQDGEGRPSGTLSVGEDITEHRRLEEQFRQAQKMEAVGRLAGGVAHDFNNILTAILGYAELLIAELPPESTHLADAAEIRTAAQRAAGLTRQLLAFSRQQVLQPTVLSVNDVVEDVEKLLRRVLGEDVTVRAALEPDVGNIRADAGQLEQVLMNLAVNARDAMGGGGKLTIETANTELSEGYAEAHQPVAAGRYVMLAVTDTGTGISPEIRSRIFEPFFTTKERGKGTGLGLSTVYGIVKQSGGYIWVYSEPGRGTTFKIYLPRVDAPVESPPPARLVAGTPVGTETILLAEDDEQLRKLVRGLLDRMGYQVLAAATAEEALARAAEHSGRIHLLLTDVVMPGAGGHQLAGRLAEVRPETRTLFMSGYTDAAIVDHGILERGLHYLQKPFTPSVLARRLRDVLDAQ
jgi:two-component system cell cycle sensor histidine kinase/response regulator CckA